VKRISFDWKAHSFPESEINLSPVVFDLLPCQTVDLSDINRLTGEAGMMLPGEPPTVRPRDYLSEYNILLI
jgi:hypothetical protein